ncbi:hypothetical protein [Tumebacillus permanentifrigoris]|uniref:Uncharacterized protein n=1 Tax=Tumebacillus permanentifrigoris TaxID=378543 RepID=A0A316D877_9BACL|nr:hypothetical protein [Tumebacillus permanentifrigoris]PWK12650.1 hypothetical protein C7459_1092 [Tumebacillus permanentifrigoris]
MQKKVLEFLLLIVIGLVLGFGIVYVKIAYFDKPDEQTQTQQVSENQGQDFGYNLGLDAPVNPQFVIDLTGQQEFHYPAKVHNFSGHDAKFSLLVYLDYKQVPELTVTFDVKNNEEKLVPVHFPLPNLGEGAHALVLSLIADSNKLTSEAKEPSEFFGTSARYTIVTKQGATYQGSPVPAPSEVTRDANGFRGVFMDQQLENFDTFKIPPKKVTAKPGESVEFLIRAGGDPEVEDYLVWTTLGWQQVPWESAQPYWYVKVPRGKYAVKKLKVTAPDKPGDYEVASFVTTAPFVIPEPAHVTQLNVNTSFRFTLHVE